MPSAACSPRGPRVTAFRGRGASGSWGWGARASRGHRHDVRGRGEGAGPKEGAQRPGGWGAVRAHCPMSQSPWRFPGSTASSSTRCPVAAERLEPSVCAALAGEAAGVHGARAPPATCTVWAAPGGVRISIPQPSLPLV